MKHFVPAVAAAALFALGSVATFGAWMSKIAPSKWGEHTALLGVPTFIALLLHRGGRR